VAQAVSKRADGEVIGFDGMLHLGDELDVWNRGPRLGGPAGDPRSMALEQPSGLHPGLPSASTLGLALRACMFRSVRVASTKKDTEGVKKEGDMWTHN
jgi:hypothetical protein